MDIQNLPALKSLSLSALKVFSKMHEEILRHPELLTSYADDFYKVDRAVLHRHHCPESRWLWVVTDTGTHLTRLGLHPKSSEWATATLNQSRQRLVAYLVAGEGIKSLSKQQARDEIARPGYRLGEYFIDSPNGSRFTFVATKFAKQTDGNSYVNIDFQGPDSLPPQHLSDLGLMAGSIAVSATGTLFAKIESCRYNGKCLWTELDSRQVHHSLSRTTPCLDLLVHDVAFA